MSTTRTMGLLSEFGSKDGELYEKIFFVLHDERDQYTPEYKQDGEDDPFNFPENTYIYDWKIKAISDHWEITIKACDDNYNWSDDTSSLSGCIDTEGSQKGIIYTAKYNVVEQEKQLYTPVYGKPGNATPFSFPENTFIYDWKISASKEALGDDETESACGAKSWTIIVKACNNDYDWGKEQKRMCNISNVSSKKGTQYTQKQLITASEKNAISIAYKSEGNGFGFPINTYIYQWEFHPVYTNPVVAEDDKVAGYTDVTANCPTHWIFITKACNDDYDWGDGFDNGCITQIGGQEGIKYVGTFYYTKDELETKTPSYGDNGEDHGFPEHTYIYNWKIESSDKVISEEEPTDCAVSYKLTIEACNDGYDWHKDVKRINQIKSLSDKNGTKYTKVDLITNAEKISATIKFGDAANTYGFPANTYVYRWEFQPVYKNPTPNGINKVSGYTDVTTNGPTHWTFIIEACDNNYNWDKYHRVGEIIHDGGEKGTLYTGIYFIPSSKKSLYTPSYRDNASVSPFFFPANTYIYKWNLKPVYSYPVQNTPTIEMGGVTNPRTDNPSHYIVTINACDNDYIWSGSRSLGGYDPLDLAKKSYEITQIFFPKEWYGIIHWKDHEQYSLWTEYKQDPENHITITPPKIAFGENVEAKAPTDFVFANSYVGQKSVGDSGYIAPSKGVFIANEEAKSWWADAEKLKNHYEWVDQKVDTTLYSLDMYRATTNSLESYIGWNGINGGFTPPSGCTPSGYTSSGQWRSTFQTIQGDAIKSNGTTYDLIKRKMLLAPKDLRWKKDGLFGDTWDW